MQKHLFWYDDIKHVEPKSIKKRGIFKITLKKFLKYSTYVYGK